MFKANLGSKNKKMCKVRPYTIPTVHPGHQFFRERQILLNIKHLNIK